VKFNNVGKKLDLVLVNRKISVKIIIIKRVLAINSFYYILLICHLTFEKRDILNKICEGMFLQ